MKKTIAICYSFFIFGYYIIGDSMNKISRSDKIKKDLINEIGFRDKNKYKKNELKDKINNFSNDLNRYNSF